MRVLIVDDDPHMRSAYGLMLDELSVDLQFAAAAESAEELLRATIFDVVLLDQNLAGPGAGPVGLELIDVIRNWCPLAVVLVVSGFWQEPNAVQQALDRGAHNYLVKGAHLQTLLLAQLRLVASSLNERRRAGLALPELNAHIERAWRDLQTSGDAQGHGRLLEDLVVYLLESIDGFREIRARHSNGVEEFDVVAYAEEQRWHRVSAYWLFECKNWSRPVGRSECDVLAAKMGRRHGRVTVGFMVAWSGVTEPFARTASREDATICVVERDDLREMVGAEDRAAVLQSWVDRAVMA